MRIIALTALTASIALVSSVASAAPADSFKFHYAGYELASDGGANALYARISKVAAAKCSAGVRASITQRLAAQRCASDMAGQFVQKIGDQRLVALHASVSNEPLTVGENKY